VSNMDHLKAQLALRFKALNPKQSQTMKTAKTIVIGSEDEG